MKKLLVSLLMLWPAMADASDLPMRHAALAPAMTWNGIYVGVSGGYGTDLNNSNGFIGGGFAGYNYQFNNWLVLGIETEFNGTNISGTTSQVGKIDTVPFATQDKVTLNWLGSTRGRVGILPWSSLMIYGTGGIAYGGTETTSISSIGSSSLNSSFATTLSSTSINAGWIAGAGAEYMLTPNWSLRGEWLYYDISVSKGNLVRGGVAYRF